MKRLVKEARADNAVTERRAALVTDVEPSEIVRGTIIVHHPVEGVDVGHVAHSTEVGITLDPWGLLHPLPGATNEIVNLAHVALIVPVVEVLAGDFSDPNVQIELVMEFGHVCNEILDFDVVIVQCEAIHASWTLGPKFLEPVEAVRSGGGCSGDESVALGLQGLEGAIPKRDGFINTHVRLVRVIKLVDKECMASISVLVRLLDEVVLVVTTPEHGNALETQFRCVGGAIRAPSVKPAGPVTSPFGEIPLTVWPSEAQFTRGVRSTSIAALVTAAAATRIAAATSVTAAAATSITTAASTAVVHGG